MNKSEAKKYVILAMLVAGAASTARDFTTGQTPNVRRAIGLFVALLLLSLGAEFFPEVVGPLAILVMVTSLFVAGESLWTVVNTIQGSK